MSARWRITRRKFIASEETAQAIIVAVTCLHNYLVMNEENRPPEQRRYIPVGFADRVGEDGHVIPGNWRGEGEDEDEPDRDLQAGEFAFVVDDPAAAARIREELADYFLEEGEVPWQWAYMKWVD